MNSNQLSVMSRRERDVIVLLLQGRSNKQIALSLGISERTVEFHLNNIYAKAHVASRVELILKLGEGKGGVFENPVESTVEIESKSNDNGNQVARPRATASLRNTVSLIKQEVAMTIKISFEELDNYLKRHPLVYSLLIFLIISLSTRWVMFGLGLYHWASYVLLGIILASGSIYFGFGWRKMTAREGQIQPLPSIIVSALLPLMAGLFDQVYIQTVLRYKEATSVTIAGIYAKASWLMSPEGYFYLYRMRQTNSDDLWLWVSSSMLLLFIMSLVASKRYDKNKLIAV